MQRINNGEFWTGLLPVTILFIILTVLWLVLRWKVLIPAAAISAVIAVILACYALKNWLRWGQIYQKYDLFFETFKDSLKKDMGNPSVARLASVPMGNIVNAANNHLANKADQVIRHGSIRRGERLNQLEVNVLDRHIRIAYACIGFCVRYDESHEFIDAAYSALD